MSSCNGPLLRSLRASPLTAACTWPVLSRLCRAFAASDWPCPGLPPHCWRRPPRRLRLLVLSWVRVCSRSARAARVRRGPCVPCESRVAGAALWSCVPCVPRVSCVVLCCLVLNHTQDRQADGPLVACLIRNFFHSSFLVTGCLVMSRAVSIDWILENGNHLPRYGENRSPICLPSLKARKPTDPRCHLPSNHTKSSQPRPRPAEILSTHSPKDASPTYPPPSSSSPLHQHASWPSSLPPSPPSRAAQSRPWPP